MSSASILHGSDGPETPSIETNKPEDAAENELEMRREPITLVNIQKDQISKGLFVWDLFVFAVSLLVLATAIAVSVLLIPYISSALALSLIPHLAISCIALLPLFISLMVLFRLLVNSYSILFSEYPILPFGDERISSYSPVLLLVAPLFLDVLHLVFKLQAKKESSEQRPSTGPKIAIIVGVLNLPVSLGFGIYVSVQLLPSLIPDVVMVTGAPYWVAVLYSVSVTAVFIMLTSWLLTAPFMLANAGVSIHTRYKNWGKDKYKDRLLITQCITLALGVTLACYLSYLVFPMLVQVLLPLLSTSTAIFVAVCACVGFVSMSARSLVTLFEKGPVMVVVGASLAKKAWQNVTTGYSDYSAKRAGAKVNKNAIPEVTRNSPPLASSALSALSNLPIPRGDLPRTYFFQIENKNFAWCVRIDSAGTPCFFNKRTKAIYYEVPDELKQDQEVLRNLLVSASTSSWKLGVDQARPDATDRIYFYSSSPADSPTAESQWEMPNGWKGELALSTHQYENASP